MTLAVSVPDTFNVVGACGRLAETCPDADDIPISMLTFIVSTQCSMLKFNQF
jgi:hypothetical protein